MAKKSSKNTNSLGKNKKKFQNAGLKTNTNQMRNKRFGQVGLEENSDEKEYDYTDWNWDSPNLTGRGLDITPISSDLLSPIGPIRTYTREERAEMERYAKMSPEEKQKERDKYNGFVVPSTSFDYRPAETQGYPEIRGRETGPQSSVLNQQQTLEAGEAQAGTPQAVKQAQELSRKAEPEKSREKARNPFENVKWNDVLDAVQVGLYGVDAFLRRQDAIRNRRNYRRRLRNVFTQKPIYDYNYLYGPDSRGGTQYQSMIKEMAKKGANIRRGTSPDVTYVEVEGGEFIQLPDLSTQHIQGPSHAQGGVHTNLPEGARVFSDYLKPIGSKKTYAEIAKKYDTEKYKKVLENPFANDIDRRTAYLLFKKNESILNELFKDQQKQNGNSDGTDQVQEAEMQYANQSQQQPMELPMEQMYGRQEENQEAMGKFGLDLKKGEKLSFTDPFEFGGQYFGGYAEFQDGGMQTDNPQYLEEDYFIPNRDITYDRAIQNDQEVDAREFEYGDLNPGWKLPPTDEEKFQSFFATLPPNLRVDDNTYNIRGYWDALGKPANFDYAQPREEDGYYHAFSRHPRTGMMLKSPSHPTYQMALQADIAQGYRPMQDPRGNVYTISPQDMPSEGYFANYEDGGYFMDGGMFPEDSTFYAATPGDSSILTTGTEIMGDFSFQDGGLKGRKRISQISLDYQDTPSYEYKEESVPEMKERLKNALLHWGLDSKENIDKLEKAKNIAELGKIAGMVQKKVAKDQTAVAEDFGFRTPPTKSGFKYLNNLGDAKLKQILKEDNLVQAVKNVKGGSYFLTPQQRTLITQRIQENLPSDLRKDYAVSNFQDEEFYYRYPRVEQVEFDNEQEYNDYLKNVNVGGKYVADENKLGLYIEPIFKKPEEKIPLGEEKKKEEGISLSNLYPGVLPFKQTSSTPGKFQAYQAIPEAMGYLAGLNPYTYYTPDYTHTEIAPPTLNIDAQLQSIDDSLQSTLRQSTGNASVDASRRAALFNQAAQAKQQLFENKRNYEANARLQVDQYNAQARDLESFRDVTSAANVYNEYMAAAQDAAERERLGAISSLVKKKAQFDQDEFKKMLYVSALIPNFYYEGTDLRNPLKLNPYAEEFYSRMAGRYPANAATQAVPVGKSASNAAPVVNSAPTVMQTSQGPQVVVPTNVVSPEVAANVLNLTPNPLYSWWWGQPQMNQNIAYPNFGPTYNMAGYNAANPNVPVTMLPNNVPSTYVPYEMGIPEVNPQDIYMMDEGKLKFGGNIKKNKSKRK